MFANHNTKARSAFIAATIAALLAAFASNLHAQSPLTVQPSTGRVGVGNTNPTETVDVTGTVKATNFKGDGSLLTNLPQAGQWTTSVDHLLQCQQRQSRHRHDDLRSNFGSQWRIQTRQPRDWRLVQIKCG